VVDGEVEKEAQDKEGDKPYLVEQPRKGGVDGENYVEIHPAWPVEERWRLVGRLP